MAKVIPDELEKILQQVKDNRELSVSIVIKNGYELSDLTSYLQKKKISFREVTDLGIVATRLKKGMIYDLASQPYVILILYDEPLKA